MMLEIPVEAIPAQILTVQLEEDKYKFDLQWNDRGSYFTMSISNAVTGEYLCYGLPMVLGVDLLYAYNFGIGSLILVDTSNRGGEATVDTLGNTVKLYWFSEDEKDVILQ